MPLIIGENVDVYYYKHIVFYAILQLRKKNVKFCNFISGIAQSIRFQWKPCVGFILSRLKSLVVCRYQSKTTKCFIIIHNR